MPKAKKKRPYHRRTPQEMIADLEARIAELKAKAKATDGFNSEDVAAERERLGLTAAQYAELVGVSLPTIMNWEHGRTSPRPAQAEKWLEVEGIARRAALKRLGLQETDRSKFSPEAVQAERERLELAAADYAELVGVSQLTIYSWEHGRTEPRRAALEKWLAVKGISKKAAWDQLGIEEEDLAGFSPDAVMAERDRLELSAADYGALVGVSALTIYNWEKGKTSPREAQLEKWLAVKGIGKREAWRRVGV